MKSALLVVIAVMISTVSAMAQGRWIEFSPAQSWVGFDPPGISAFPTRSEEWVSPGSPSRNSRSVRYFFNSSGGNDAYAHIRLTVAASGYVMRGPVDFSGNLPFYYGELNLWHIDWVDLQHLNASSPLGLIEYRRFNVMGNSCVAFGGLFGRGSPNPEFRTGGETLMGYYCAIRGYTLSEADVQLVLSRLSIEGLGKAQGASPPQFIVTHVPVAPVSATSTENVLSVIVSWQGRPSPLSGTLTVEPDKTGARLEVHLPDQEKACPGISLLGSNGRGRWNVECPDGTTGKGSFRPNTINGGYIGEGIDNKGARISFAIEGRRWP
ncbi:hypothetical protein [Ferrovibrio terrae]|uniref:hypothetical protein n=1 Tax=Ferrovibrio terrae TaxID=2594003 RepID=UPI003137E80B